MQNNFNYDYYKVIWKFHKDGKVFYLVADQVFRSFAQSEDLKKYPGGEYSPNYCGYIIEFSSPMHIWLALQGFTCQEMGEYPQLLTPSVVNLATLKTNQEDKNSKRLYNDYTH